MALGVHALDVGIVVLPLRAVAGAACRIGADGTAGHHADTRANRRALIASDGCPGDSTYCRADCCRRDS